MKKLHLRYFSGLSNTFLYKVLLITSSFQYTVEFEVVDGKDSPLQNAQIIIKMEADGDAVDTLTTADTGKVEMSQMHPFATSFPIVQVTREGYELASDLSAGITVTAEEPNQVKITMNIKSVST